MPDFAITRGSGDPLYTLVNPVDDALMKITHVLRGEDILPSTPRQIALYQALMRIGVADAIPEFAHLPSVLGDGNKKLSKRDPQSNLFLHRDRGFIPEGLLNYLALLGWGIADDHDVFSLDEMVAAFDVNDVNSNPARFDQKKADAINAEHIRLLAPEDFAARLRAYFAAHGHDTGLDDAGFAEAAELVQTRIVVLGDAWDLLKFLDDGVLRARREGRGQGARADAVPGAGRRAGRAGGGAGLDDREHRGGAEDGAARRPGAQAAQGVRADPGGRHGRRRSARRCSSRWSCSGRERSLARLRAAATTRAAGRREKWRRNLW